METQGTAHIGKEKRAVAFYSILAAIVMITGKSIVGLMTGSLAILTDALHSILDLGASIVTYFAVRFSDKPADSHHHFGHGKIESLAALAQVVILLITCGWIISEAVKRLLGQADPLQMSVWAFVVIIGSIAIDITRVRALKKVARKYKSQALEADALNFSTDIFSSLVVLFGLVAVQFGFANADAIAAIGVALFIISATIRLGKQSIDVLLDRAPMDTEGMIREIVSRPAEVISVNNIRLRSDGKTTFAEIVLDVDRTIPFARATALKEHIRAQLKEKLEDVDTTCSLKPISAGSEGITDEIDFAVESFGYPVHDLIVKNEGDGYFVSMHIEMPEDMLLKDAHDKASAITAALHKAVPEIKKAVIYTQPKQSRQMYDLEHPPDLEKIEANIKNIIESFPEIQDCHNIVLTVHGSGLALSADMRLDGNKTLAETERASAAVKMRLRAEFNELIAITLHLEPYK